MELGGREGSSPKEQHSLAGCEGVPMSSRSDEPPMSPCRPVASARLPDHDDDTLSIASPACFRTACSPLVRPIAPKASFHKSPPPPIIVSPCRLTRSAKREREEFDDLTAAERPSVVRHLGDVPLGNIPGEPQKLMQCTHDLSAATMAHLRCCTRVSQAIHCSRDKPDQSRAMRAPSRITASSTRSYMPDWSLGDWAHKIRC